MKSHLQEFFLSLFSSIVHLKDSFFSLSSQGIEWSFTSTRSNDSQTRISVCSFIYRTKENEIFTEQMRSNENLLLIKSIEFHSNEMSYRLYSFLFIWIEFQDKFKEIYQTNERKSSKSYSNLGKKQANRSKNKSINYEHVFRSFVKDCSLSKEFFFV